MEYEREERDVLRARFTVWIETLIKNAKIDYLRKMKNQMTHISIATIPEEFLVLEDNEDQWIHKMEPVSPYDFEEERLTIAFMNLPLKRRQIMELLFLKGLSEKEVANRLNCSVQHVNHQKSIAIEKLRESFLEE